ncbi:MAG: T9SS C-terminal target domain-containing protein, partial [Calditrichaeota bacterium]
PYRLCRPDGFDPTKTYPLILALHGSGECGTDNESHILVHRLATSWADSANQKNYPCYVVAPQCPIGGAWNNYNFNDRDSYRYSQVPITLEMLTIIDLLDSLEAAYPIDPDRLYVTGLSLGGYGTWDILMRYPEKFAAAIPMSGGGDSTAVERIKHIPTWVFHGEKDNTVPVSESRKMIEALERQGLPCLYTHCRYGDCTGMSNDEIQAAIESGARLLYTEWQGKDHVMWAESYDYPFLFPWVFSQNRKNNPPSTTVAQNMPPLITGLELRQNYPNPFNPQTTIVFDLHQSGDVRVELLNIQGQRIRSLFLGHQEAGNHRIIVDASGLPSGKYLYQISSGDFCASAIMTLQK